MVTRPERIEAWWERNRQWRTREDWRKAAEKDAVALAGSDRPSQERLSGCLLLLMFGGHDDEICRAVFEIYRDARADDEEHWRRRRCLGFLVNESSPWLDFKGRPAKRMESFLLKQLEEEPADKDRTALLGLCWELCSNRSDWLPSFGKVFPLTSLRPILRGTLKSKDPVDRTLAALTLAFLEESEGEEVLCQGLREARAEVPWVATADRWTDRGPNGLSVYLLEALKKLGTTSAQEAIRLHANHSNVRVKVVAWEALARLGDKSILPAIREFLDKRDGEPINMNGLWRDAVDCLYRLDREGALQWCRKEFQGKREFTFFHWLVANLLARNSERLAVELWIASPFDTWSGAWQEIPKIRAEVLIPALLDLIEQGSPQARRGLALFVPQEAAHEKSVQELRAWWRANAATFKITRQNLQDVEK
jgi:hypothetical protein